MAEELAMSAFDPVKQTGIPFHLRPSTPEEIETHRRLLTAMEAIRREAIRCGRIKEPVFAQDDEHPVAEAA
jgi:hypothetical protein